MTPAVAFLAIVAAQSGPYARAELVASVQRITPGKPFLAAVVMRPAEGWHVYWSNPGDSGMATTVEWKLPVGWRAEPLIYPAPKRFEDAGLVTYGYDEPTLLISRITPAAGAKSNPIRATVKWLACKEACVPGSAELKLALPSGSEQPSQTWSERLSAAERLLPAAAQGWSFEARKSPDGYTLLAVPGEEFEGTPRFFPLESGLIEDSAEQVFERSDGRSTLRLKRSQFANGSPKRLRGLLIAPEGRTWKSGAEAILVEAPLK